VETPKKADHQNAEGAEEKEKRRKKFLQDFFCDFCASSAPSAFW
jgi:hypothetical protein